MSEELGDEHHVPKPEMFDLYRLWARSGAGMLLTGNVMVDSRAMITLTNVALEADTPLAPFREWVRAAEGPAPLWMQINHPGAQACPRPGGVCLAPSPQRDERGNEAVSGMSAADIDDVVTRFGTTARRAVEAGFQGIQVHGAHGYLAAQFLSPATNQRSDRYGGSIENRTRFPAEVLDRVRREVAGRAPVAVKLNSGDYRRAGWSLEEAGRALDVLAETRPDCVEIAGADFESPQPKPDDAGERAAYFHAFASMARDRFDCPILFNGGLRRRETMDRLIASGEADGISVGTPMTFEPAFPEELLQDRMPDLLRDEARELDNLSAGERYVWYLERLSELPSLVLP